MLLRVGAVEARERLDGLDGSSHPGGARGTCRGCQSPGRLTRSTVRRDGVGFHLATAKSELGLSTSPGGCVEDPAIMLGRANYPGEAPD